MVYASTICNEIRNHCFVLYSFASGTSCRCKLISTKTQKCPVFVEILRKIKLVINMFPIDFENCAILIYTLKLNDRAHYWQVFYGFPINCGGSVNFHYRIIVGGETINTPLESSVELMGLLLKVPGYDFCGEQLKVGIKLMCTFGEKI